jgi:hypothetical protein
VTGFAISQMLAGWPGQGAYNALLLIGSYLAFRILIAKGRGVLEGRDRIVRLVGDGIGVLGFGFAIGAAGLLPRLDVVSRTNVAGGEYSGLRRRQLLLRLARLHHPPAQLHRPERLPLLPLLPRRPDGDPDVRRARPAWRRFWVGYFAAMTWSSGC